MAIPTTIEQTETELQNAIKNYYLVLESGDSTEVASALSLVNSMKTLLSEFQSGNPSVLIKQMAESYFQTAISNPTTENITEAFESFSSYTSYVNRNSIGFDTDTGLPIFPSGDSVVVYNDDGEYHIISSTGD